MARWNIGKGSRARPFVILGLIALGSTAAFAAVAMNDILPVPLKPVIPAQQRACAQKTASGLGYTVLRAAQGKQPGEGDTVLVNYIGYLKATGAVFDQNAPAAFPVGEVIPGFSEGLKMMQQGSVYRFCIPSGIGYGEKGAGADIPPNSDLVFQVELVDLKSQAEIDAMRKEGGE